MTETATTGTPTTSGPNLLARLIGVVVAPRDAFAAIVARPRWFGALVVVLLITVAAQSGFLATAVGKEAYIDQQTKAMDSLRSMGLNIPDRAYDQIEGRAASAPYVQGISILVIAPIFYVILAAIYLAVFNALLGGDGSFRQVFAVLAHSGVIGAIQQVFNVPVQYFKGEISSATRLSVFFPMLDEMSFLNYFLSAIDLFIVWSVIVTSIGLAVLYKRRTGPIAVTQLVIYAVIAVIIAAFRAS